MLPDDIARCIGVGTSEGQPNAECLTCERRQQGLHDYLHGVRCLWMAPPTEQPCPQRLEPKGKR